LRATARPQIQLWWKIKSNQKLLIEVGSTIATTTSVQGQQMVDGRHYMPACLRKPIYNSWAQ
jgi:hypothetical protein